ncbi:MAG: hypothetical protein EB132_04590, partial [Actinobacteria bacterium]|nr:hypothetical protein [Actinomycetota bacterium]
MQPVERTVLWSPTPERANASQITRFAELATQRCGVAEGDLHSWSVASPEQFWGLVWEFCSVRGVRGERVYVAPSDPAKPST